MQTSYTAKLTTIFLPFPAHTVLAPMALAVWQLSPANTDDDSQYITALEIIIVQRVDSKTPPGMLGCQLQHGKSAKVTGLFPYGQPGMPHLWPRLLRPQARSKCLTEPGETHEECKLVTNLLTLLVRKISQCLSDYFNSSQCHVFNINTSSFQNCHVICHYRNGKFHNMSLESELPMCLTTYTLHTPDWNDLRKPPFKLNLCQKVTLILGLNLLQKLSIGIVTAAAISFPYLLYLQIWSVRSHFFFPPEVRSRGISLKWGLQRTRWKVTWGLLLLPRKYWWGSLMSCNVPVIHGGLGNRLAHVL